MSVTSISNKLIFLRANHEEHFKSCEQTELASLKVLQSHTGYQSLELNSHWCVSKRQIDVQNVFKDPLCYMDVQQQVWYQESKEDGL